MDSLTIALLVQSMSLLVLTIITGIEVRADRKKSDKSDATENGETKH